MELYLLYRCPFGHRAAIALREKGLPFELRFFDRAKRPPELEAVGPHAKSPTLFDGDARVHDSLVVLEYIEDNHHDRPLMPATAKGRAAVRSLITRLQEDLMPKFGAVAAEALFKPQREEAKVAQAVDAVVAQLGPWNERLAGGAFVAGDALTNADIALYTMFPALQNMAGFTVPESLPHLRAWVERMAARPTTALPTPPA